MKLVNPLLRKEKKKVPRCTHNCRCSQNSSGQDIEPRLRTASLKEKKAEKDCNPSTMKTLVIPQEKKFR